MISEPDTSYIDNEISTLNIKIYKIRDDIQNVKHEESSKVLSSHLTYLEGLKEEFLKRK